MMSCTRDNSFCLALARSLVSATWACCLYCLISMYRSWVIYVASDRQGSIYWQSKYGQSTHYILHYTDSPVDWSIPLKRNTSNVFLSNQTTTRNWLILKMLLEERDMVLLQAKVSQHACLYAGIEIVFKSQTIILNCSLLYLDVKLYPHPLVQKWNSYYLPDLTYIFTHL